MNAFALYARLAMRTVVVDTFMVGWLVGWLSVCRLVVAL